MKEIKICSTSVSVSGNYYTEVRQIHYDENKKIVRVSYAGDRCLDEEFLSQIETYLPELKGKEPVLVYDDNVDHLLNWNQGDPDKSPFQIVVFFFK